MKIEMKLGILYFDNDPKSSLASKVEKAVTCFGNKYGITPDICYIHPNLLDRVTSINRKIKILPSRKISPNHLWIGISND
jgi:hypothetical protein